MRLNNGKAEILCPRECVTQAENPILEEHPTNLQQGMVRMRILLYPGSGPESQKRDFDGGGQIQ